MELCARGHAVRGTFRSVPDIELGADAEAFVVGDLNASTDWSAALEGVDCVVHCAARSHVMQRGQRDSLSEYQCVNIDGARRLAEQAAAFGVRRLVFLSSIKVNGEQTAPGVPFLFSDVAAPEDAYGSSKWKAEQALWKVAADTGLDVVVVRPPLVYGPGAKGNLNRFLKLACSGVPLPLASVQNKRSLIGLDNLVDLLIRCVDHRGVARQTLLVSDGEDVSTPDLLRYMMASMGRAVRIFPVPVPMLRLTGFALGRVAEVDRLVGSLQIDSCHTRKLLNWVPPVSLIEGIRRMVQAA